MVSKRRKPQACVTWRLRTGYHTRWRGLESHLLVSHACISIDLTLLLLALLSNGIKDRAHNTYAHSLFSEQSKNAQYVPSL